MKKAKVVVLGQAGVGKSSLIERYVKGTFSQQRPSIGVDFYQKK